MTLVRWQATVQNDAGDAVVNPSVTVRKASDNSLADIFDDAGSAKANPFIGTSEGFVSFRANPGEYIIQGASGAENAPDWRVTLGAGFNNGFTTRAALLDALSWQWPVGSVASDGAVQYEYVGTGTDIPDMPGWVPYGQASLEHWGGSTSATAGQRDAAMVNAMAWLNVGNRTLKLPDGDVSFTTTWPALTGTRSNIIGPNSRAILAAASTGSLLVFGTDSLRATNCSVDLAGWSINVTFANDPMVRYHNAFGCRVTGRIDNCNSVAVFGGATTTARNCNMDLSGLWTRGADCDQVILIQNAANLTISGNLTCGVASNGNANGAYIRIKPVAGGSVDTVRFNSFGAQGFNATAANRDVDHQAKPYGVVLDMTDGAVTNISFDGFCFLDHTSVAGVLYVDAAGSAFFGRAIQFGGMRFGSCYGQFAKLNKLSGTSHAVQLDFSDIAVLQRGLSSAPTMEISGTGWIGCQFTSSAIRDSYVTTRGAAIDINSNGWVISDISVGSNTSSTSQFTSGVSVGPDVTNILIKDIQCDPAIPTIVALPSSWTTATAPRRHVSWPGLTTQRTIAFDGSSTLTDSAITSGAIEIGEASICLLNMSAPQTVTDITKTFPGVMRVTFINTSANAVTFNHAGGKLRNNSGAAIVLGQHQSVTYQWRSGTAWQQI